MNIGKPLNSIFNKVASSSVGQYVGRNVERITSSRAGQFVGKNVVNTKNMFLTGGTLVQVELGDPWIAAVMGSSIPLGILNDTLPNTDKQKEAIRKYASKYAEAAYNFLRHPNITTRALTACTGAQFLYSVEAWADVVPNVVSTNTESDLFNALVVAGFGLGTIADYVLNRVQDINLQEKFAAASRARSKVVDMAKAISVQPVFWWSACNMAFTSAVYAKGGIGTDPVEIIATGAAFASYLAATGYTLNQIRRCLNGSIPADQINNGNEAKIASGGYASQALLAASKDQYFYMVGMAIFVRGMFKLAGETKEAERKIGVGETKDPAPTV